MSSRLTPHRHFATSRAALFAVSLLGVQGIAMAATLGPMLLMSGQGEPLKAEIEIVAIQPGEEDSLAASVAPRLVYERAQLPYPFATLATNLKIERRADGKQVILLTSTEPVPQDNLDLLIELQAGKQSMTRRYPVTLALRSADTQTKAVNTPAATSTATSPSASAEAIAATAAITAPAVAPSAVTAQPAQQAQAEPATPAAKPVAEAPAAKPSRPIAVAAERSAEEAAPKPQQPMAAEAVAADKPSAAGKTRGPVDKSAAAGPKSVKSESNALVVASGDYLNKIIDQVDTNGATREQAKVAIYRANPKAFFGSVHQLRAGVPLIVPAATEMAAIDQNTAVRELRAQTRRFSETLAAGGVSPGSAGKAASAPAGEKGDRLSLSANNTNNSKGPAASMANRDESQTAVNNALKEANSRISDLQRNVNDLKALIALKDRQIAQATTAINLSRPAGAAPSPATAAVAAATAVNATNAANNLNASSTATTTTPAATESAGPSAAGNNPATTPTVSAEPKPATPKPIPAAKPATKNVAIEPESDGSLTWWLSIVAGVLALVGLGFMLRKYLAKREERRLDELESELAAENSIFKTQTRSAPETARV